MSAMNILEKSHIFFNSRSEVEPKALLSQNMLLIITVKICMVLSG